MISSSSRKDGYKIVAYLPAPRGESVKAAGMQLHEAFANLDDDPKAFKAFTKRWGEIWEGWEEIRRHEAKLGVRNNLRRAWRGDENIFSQPSRLLVWLTTAKWPFEMQTRDLIGTLQILFLRDHLAGNTAICANPDCVRPYFIRRRKTQKYCEAGACTAEAQRRQKLDWWNKNKRRKRA